MNFKAKLVKGTFLFGQSINMLHDVDYSFDSDALAYQDLLILSAKALDGSVSLSVDAEKLRTEGLNRAPEHVKELESGRVVSTPENTTIEVVEVEEKPEEEAVKAFVESEDEEQQDQQDEQGEQEEKPARRRGRKASE